MKKDGLGKRLGGYLLLIGAVVCFGEAIYLLYQDKAGSAAVAAGLFVVLLLLRILPELESLKAFGIEAVLRRKVQEAEKILHQLRASALVTAEATYHMLAYSNRFGDPMVEKQKLAEAVNKMLADLETDPAEVERLRRPFVRSQLFDLVVLVRGVAYRGMQMREQQLGARLIELAHDYTKQEAVDLRDRVNRMTEYRRVHNNIVFSEGNFRGSVDGAVPPKGMLNKDEDDKPRAFGDKIIRLGEAYQSSGILPDEALPILMKFAESNANEIADELFSKPL